MLFSSIPGREVKAILNMQAADHGHEVMALRNRGISHRQHNRFLITKTPGVNGLVKVGVFGRGKDRSQA